MMSMTTSLYQWGIIYDARTRKRDKSHVPTATPTIFKGRQEGEYRQVSCGTNFTLVLDSNHRVYVVGDEPKYGRLGQGDDTTIVPVLTPIKGALPPIEYISCGPSSSILLTIDRHELWGFGKGMGAVPKQVFQSDEVITHCACGENSLVVVINGSQIHERRFNRDGFITEWTCVYRLTNDDRVQNLDLGSSLKGFVTEQGHVYLWGASVPIGQVSSGERFTNVPVTNPVRRDLTGDNSDRPVQISCSRGNFHAHALLLTQQGCIYAMGSNYKTKLSFDKDFPFTGEWTLIEVTRTIPFKFVAAGGIHSSALSVDGRIFTWGCGSDGRLGHPEARGHRYLYKEGEPRSIDGLSNQQIVSVATSYYHMATVAMQST